MNTRVRAAALDPTKVTPFQLLLYRVVRLASALFSRAFWKLRVVGRDHVPPAGPFILAPVHRSNVDSILVADVTGRRVRYMGKQEMWKYAFSSWFFTSMGGVPVDRGSADREALRTCTTLLRAGEPVVMFPEGQRRSGPVVEELYDGPAYLALRTGAPILPVGIGGSEPAMPKGARMVRPVPVTMVIGPPIWPVASDGGARAPRRAVRELSERLRVELQRLFDEAEDEVRSRSAGPSSRSAGGGG